MSIPQNSPSRGCASNFSQPLREKDVHAAQILVDNVYRVNCVQGNLNQIVYRPGNLEYDIQHPVYRWDTRPHQQIFAHGFKAGPQRKTPNNTYYNLAHFIETVGAPLESNRSPTITHAFVSTTLNSAWQPTPSMKTLRVGCQIQFYRYEVYAPGGIWVAVTLGDQYQNSSQAEVCFVGGIAPQYIRSCLIYTATRPAGSRSVRITRETRLIINGNFNPQSTPYARVVISLPLYYYRDEDGTNKFLPKETYTPKAETTKTEKLRQVLNDDNWDNAHKWYTTKVVDVPSYIDAAFRSSKAYEAYFFLKNEYVRVYYTPGDTKDKILTEPSLICDGFPSLIGTSFGENGIDCAFDTEDDKAFIFSANICAYLDYAPRTTNDKILSGPKTIAAMFPMFKDTVFENGIDTAFRSTIDKEAYIFRGNKYARINYDSKVIMGTIKDITSGFTVFRDTIFASGIDASFASHRHNEAYLFKGEYYVRIHFTPGTTDDYIMGQVQPILSGWPIRGILPRSNRGVDSHDHHDHKQPYPDQHDQTTVSSTGGNCLLPDKYKDCHDKCLFVSCSLM